MLISYKRGQTSVILRVKILNSSVSTGAGLTGLAYNSSGLVISTIADNEASATAYTQAGSTIETITTLGTYAAPTATKCRFREVDATNHKGVYEIQIADARFAVSNAKFLIVSIGGATNAAETDVVIPLQDLDPYDAVRANLSALPNANAAASGGLLTYGNSTGQLNPSSGKVPATLASTDVTGNVASDIQTIKTQSVTCAGGVTVPSATLASTTNITTAVGVMLAAATHTGAVIPTVTTTTTATNLTNAPTAGDLTATMKTSVTTAATAATPTAAAVTGSVGSVTDLTTATISTAVLDAFATASDAVAASPSPTTTAFAGSNSLSSTDSWYVGSVLLFTSGALDGLARKITSYTGSTRLITVTYGWPVAPTAADTFRILGRID